MEVPTEWSDTFDTVAAESPFQTGLAASPDIEGYANTWDFPGVFLGVSESLGQQVATAELPEVKLSEVFAALSPRDALKKDCDPTVSSLPIKAGEQNVFAANLSDLLKFGSVDLYSNCGGKGSGFPRLRRTLQGQDVRALHAGRAVREADIGATLKMIETLAVDFRRFEPATEQRRSELIVP